MADELTSVTTWSESRMHLAFVNDLQPHHRSGLVGVSLCGYDAYDQAAMDAERARYGSAPGTRFVNLPPCKRCEKKAAALEAVAE